MVGAEIAAILWPVLKVAGVLVVLYAVAKWLMGSAVARDDLKEAEENQSAQEKFRANLKKRNGDLRDWYLRRRGKL